MIREHITCKHIQTQTLIHVCAYIYVHIRYVYRYDISRIEFNMGKARNSIDNKT
jgi:hypothetical protein